MNDKIPCFHSCYHIRVVPVARSCHFSEVSFVISVPRHDALHAVERILNVAVVAPQVAVLGDARVVGLFGGNAYCDLM